MFLVVIGFKTHGVNSPCEVVYCGTDGTAAQAAIDASKSNGFAKIGKSINPMLIPCRFSEPVKAVETQPTKTETIKKGK